MEPKLGVVWHTGTMVQYNGLAQRGTRTSAVWCASATLGAHTLGEHRGSESGTHGDDVGRSANA
jgi:hypothetical protein